MFPSRKFSLPSLSTLKVPLLYACLRLQETQESSYETFPAEITRPKSALQIRLLIAEVSVHETTSNRSDKLRRLPRNDRAGG